MKIAVAIVILMIAGWAWYFSAPQKQSVLPFDPRNSSFEVEGNTITLVGGFEEREAAPSSASKITTRYIGNQTKGDLNGDGKEDQAFIISQSGAGSGQFFYVVAALGTDTGYTTTNALFIGDRIIPQSVVIDSTTGELQVMYLARNQGEPFTTQPTVPAVKLLKVTKERVLEDLLK